MLKVIKSFHICINYIY